MRLAIIGAGNVGGTLGTAWAQKAGHEVFFDLRWLGPSAAATSLQFPNPVRRRM